MVPRTPKDVLAFAKSHGAKIVDLRFTDVPGMWQHASIPISQFGEKAFAQGIGFDGSSIRGFQAIQESDMLLMPDPNTAFIDPFLEVPTLSLICNIHDPETRLPYSRDPRYIAEKAEAYLTKSRVADSSLWGPEIEFFLFDHVAYNVQPNRMGYAIDSREAVWNTGEDSERNLGYKIRPKEGYFPAPPSDCFQDVRSEAALILEQIGVTVEMHHHEVATAGQAEIDLERDHLVRMADKVMLYKYVVKNVARRKGLTATFMPKPLFGDNGNGMHTHQSLWQNGQNLFYGEGGYAELSETALRYTAGLLTHVDALLALTAPTTNSYKRLVPHYEAPVNIAFSKRNRSACVRIPMYFSGPAAAASKRVEFRPPDPSCNPYLALPAMLMAGLDGIRQKRDASTFGPLDVNTYELSGETKVRSVPGTLGEVLAALEADHEFLVEGDVFTDDLLQTWIAYKRTKELQEVNIRPHPYEFYLYYDV